MSHGLKKGLGKVMDMKVYLPTGKEGGNEDVKNLQKWTACGGNVTAAEDPYYYFYRVQACSFKSGTKVSECITNTHVPAPDKGIVEKIQTCTNNTALANELVSAMNTHAKKIHGYPTIYVGGKKQGSSSGKAIVAAICALAQEQMPDVVKDVPACGGTAPAGEVFE